VTNDLAINSGDLEVYGILSGSLTCPHLYLGSGSDLGNHGSVTLTGNDSGALWIQAGATARGNGQYFISGNFVVQGGTFIADASTVTMTGTAVGNTGISPDPVNFYNLVIDRASDKKVIIYPAVTVTNDLTINSGDLEVLATSTLACPHLYLGSGSDLYNEGHLSLTDGDLQIQSGATAQGNGHYSLVGNFALESGGAFTPDTSTVTMTGTGNHQIGNIPVNFYNVEIEKPSGNKITLINNVNVSNSLDFNSGILEVAGSASLTCPHLAVFSESQLLNYGHLTLTN
jgi:fibronectin-binding autotransporter adhesin